MKQLIVLLMLVSFLVPADVLAARDQDDIDTREVTSHVRAHVFT